ncbi:MAG: hypothetical protein MJ094_08715 [Saccharofermentans sp.]|nr:hypothetical protein [Saccharofermentans sp.]
MTNQKLKLIGIIIAVLGILVAIILPGAYRDAMKNKYQDDITSTQATVMSVSFTSEYHRGGKGSRGSTSYVYNILATSDGTMMELIKHDAKEQLQIERNDIITVYCLNDKYAYAPDDFYVMSDLLKALMISPMFVGVALVMIGSILDMRKY